MTRITNPIKNFSKKFTLKAGKLTEVPNFKPNPNTNVTDTLMASREIKDAANHPGLVKVSLENPNKILEHNGNFTHSPEVRGKLTLKLADTDLSGNFKPQYFVVSHIVIKNPESVTFHENKEATEFANRPEVSEKILEAVSAKDPKDPKDLDLVEKDKKELNLIQKNKHKKDEDNV